jgi:hypothetical protein
MFAGTAFALGGAYHWLYETAAAPSSPASPRWRSTPPGPAQPRDARRRDSGLLGFMWTTRSGTSRELSWPLLLILFGFVVLLRAWLRRLSGPNQAAGDRHTARSLELAQRKARPRCSRTAPFRLYDP